MATLHPSLCFSVNKRYLVRNVGLAFARPYSSLRDKTQTGACDTTRVDNTGEALENGDISRVFRNEQFLELLRGLSSDKIDFATAHLISHWDSLSGGDEVILSPSRRRTRIMVEHILVVGGYCPLKSPWVLLTGAVVLVGRAAPQTCPMEVLVAKVFSAKHLPRQRVVNAHRLRSLAAVKPSILCCSSTWCDVGQLFFVLRRCPAGSFSSRSLPPKPTKLWPASKNLPQTCACAGVGLRPHVHDGGRHPLRRVGKRQPQGLPHEDRRLLRGGDGHGRPPPPLRRERRRPQRLRALPLRAQQQKQHQQRQQRQRWSRGRWRRGGSRSRRRWRRWWGGGGKGVGSRGGAEGAGSCSRQVLCSGLYEVLGGQTKFSGETQPLRTFDRIDVVAHDLQVP